MPDQKDPAQKYVEAADDIEARIRSGSLAPGDALPTIREMTARYGVSPATAKIAYVRLEARGLIRRHQGKGFFVAPPEQWWTAPG
jgi:DNA-binding GntR family transcriptional regulator